MLLLDCSGFQTQVILADGFQIMAAAQTDLHARSAAALMPLIDQVYRETGTEKKATAAIAVTFGPGSFTSLRVGISTAKALSFAWNVPTIPINALDILAGGALWERNTKQPNAASIAERRSEVQTCFLFIATNAYRQQFFRKAISVPMSEVQDFNAAAFDEQSVRQQLDRYQYFSEQQRWEHSIYDDATQASSTASEVAGVKPEISTRFQLGEHRIRSQEELTPKHWRLQERTDVEEQSQWWDRMKTVANQNAFADANDSLTSENACARLLISEQATRERMQASPHAQWAHTVLVPDAVAQHNAFVRLAWAGLLNLEVADLSPYFLQPVYYRSSAAEENLGL